MVAQRVDFTAVCHVMTLQGTRDKNSTVPDVDIISPTVLGQSLDDSDCFWIVFIEIFILSLISSFSSLGGANALVACSYHWCSATHVTTDIPHHNTLHHFVC